MRVLWIECTLEAETSVSNFTQYKLFIGDDQKYTLFGMTFSFKYSNKGLPTKFSSSLANKSGGG